VPFVYFVAKLRLKSPKRPVRSQMFQLYHDCRIYALKAQLKVDGFPP